jgi:hypothetical protein
MSSSLSAQHKRQRDLVLLRTPSLWSTWPFLPVVRWLPPGQGRQLGVLYDASHHCQRYGYSATVFITNIFMLPQTQEELFSLPKFVYDTVEEMVHDGWSVD